MSNSTTHAIVVSVDQEMYDKIERLAYARQLTRHQVVKEAVDQYLDREEKREAFRQETLKSWQEHEETGMHVDADEVVAWLKTWGEDAEVTPPKSR